MANFLTSYLLVCFVVHISKTIASKTSLCLKLEPWNNNEIVSKCYIFVNSTTKTQEDARSFCMTNYNGLLAQISNLEKLSESLRKMSNSAIWVDFPCNVSADSKNCTWESGVINEDTDSELSEIGKALLAQSSICGALFINRTSKNNNWGRVNCNSSLHFLCERPSDSPILAPRDNGTILQPTRNDSTKTLLAMLGGITAAVVVIMLLVIHYRRDPIAMMVKASSIERRSVRSQRYRNYSGSLPSNFITPMGTTESAAENEAFEQDFLSHHDYQKIYGDDNTYVTINSDFGTRRMESESGNREAKRRLPFKFSFKIFRKKTSSSEASSVTTAETDPSEQPSNESSPKSQLDFPLSAVSSRADESAEVMTSFRGQPLLATNSRKPNRAVKQVCYAELQWSPVKKKIDQQRSAFSSNLHYAELWFHNDESE